MKRINLDYHHIEKRNEPIAMCLGYFDGMHIGHMKLIKEALLNTKYPLSLLTFSEPISKLINNGKNPEVITSIDDKVRYLSRFDIDSLFVLTIDRDFLELSPLDFINKILLPLNIKDIFVGEDYRFGKNRAGDPALLKEYFNVHIVKLEKDENEKISANKIKSLIQDGKMNEVRALLGRTYEVQGIVEEGNHIGTTLGFPTMNIALKDEYVIPKYGVYKVLIYVSGIPYTAIANIGVHPSIKARKSPILEVFIPNFNKEVYGNMVYVNFLEFIREEKKFASLEELKAQINKDIECLK